MAAFLSPVTTKLPVSASLTGALSTVSTTFPTHHNVVCASSSQTRVQPQTFQAPKPLQSVFSRRPCSLLWLRVGHLRLCDNAAVAAATTVSALLPIATVSRSQLAPRVIDALSSLQRTLQTIGSSLIVRIVEDCPISHVDAICQIADITRPARLFYVDDPLCDTFPMHHIQKRAISLIPYFVPSTQSIAHDCSASSLSSHLYNAPSVLPPLPDTAKKLASDSLPPRANPEGETHALQRLSNLLSIPLVSLSEVLYRLREQLRVGTLSIARVRVEYNSSRAPGKQLRRATPIRGHRDSSILQPFFATAAAAFFPAMTTLSIAAYDVNGGDRRGVEWDNESKSFVLKEWEHTENERRMPPRQRFGEFLRRRRQFLTRAFFPDDVTPDYYSFTIWRFAQRCVSSTIGVFGTSSLLYALGVRSGRIGQAAAISWVLKDGLGRVGKMVWAGSMSKDFDVDPKRWRFRSALLFALGNGLEIVTQIFPASFLLFATVANSMKQVSMMTASATRNAMYRSFGERSQNIANITAKGEAQIVIADLIGMAAGIQLSKVVTTRGRILGVYLTMTMLDVLGIYMELRQVVFRSLNAERASIVINRLLHDGILLTPSQASPRERIFLRPRHKEWVRMTSIAKAATDPEELNMLLNVFRKERFMVAVPRSRKGGPCRLVLRRDASNSDVLRAMLMIGYVRSELKAHGKEDISLFEIERILRYARTLTKRAFPSFVEGLRQNGWSTDNLLFGTLKRRGFWN